MICLFIVNIKVVILLLWKTLINDFLFSDFTFKINPISGCITSLTPFNNNNNDNNNNNNNNNDNNNLNNNKLY